MCVCVSVSVYVYVYVYVYVCMYACMHVCMICACTYVCTYLCMHACMYVCRCWEVWLQRPVTPSYGNSQTCRQIPRPQSPIYILRGEFPPGAAEPHRAKNSEARGPCKDEDMYKLWVL